MNKFLITGLPRSGTTIFARTLSQLDNVSMPNDKHDFFEPFKIMAKPVELNCLPRLKSLENNCQSKYFGFKCFNRDLLNVSDLSRDGYKTFAIIRKDIWKSIFSHAIAKTALFVDGENIFANSSTLHIQDLVAKTVKEMPPPLIRMFQDSFFDRIKDAYEFETQWKNIDIIYFEDLIKPNASFDCVNEYFNEEIIFNLNYDDTSDIEVYYPNIDPKVLRYISAQIISSIILPKDCPKYIIDAMYKYFKE